MLASIVIIPGLLAAYIAWTQSPHQAFLKVYIPVLLLLPSYYDWPISGIPDPSFQFMAIIPIFMVWLIRGLPGWRFSLLDILVLTYAVSVGYSEYLNAGYKDAQNFLANGVLVSILLPYILAKSLIEPAGLREEAAKQIVIVLLMVATLSLYQSLTLSPYTLWQKILGRFFSGQAWNLTTQYRWGLPRAMGPYDHAILAGIIMVVGYRIQRWLEWNRVWPPRLRYLSWFPLPPARLFSIGLFIGALMTLVRGPLSGAIVAAVIPLIGRSNKRWLIFFVILTGAIIVGIPTAKWFIDYASIDPEQAEDVNQGTAAYRWQLMINYIDIVKEQIVWGWGRFGWPKSKVQGSIDNHFLLLSLRHGMMGFVPFVTIFL
ncbi:MAG: O-antigen ligase family protein [Thioploca sp.]|nr:O-antigen ligase family protein [Thioploca sp.]